MKLVVKYGPSLSIAEGQCLWAIQKSIGQEVPVPEVYDWCRHRNDVFIYMQLVEGQTLEDAWDTLAENDRTQIHQQLRHILTSLRSLRQASHESFLGKF
jgi:aminoglycoside phosphotransferase (APT) family kinase protein